MNYKKYYLSKTEVLVCIIKSLAASGIAAWVLYQSFYGMITFFVFVPVYIRKQKEKGYRGRKEKLVMQFKDAMLSVAAALQAGYSMENAWKESEKEVRELYGENALFVKELQKINLAVGVNQPIEKLLYEFALRSDCEDIQNFAEVFLFAKRSGGDFHKIIQTTIEHISDKIEVEKEIQTIISAKKLEQKIMNIVPVAILFYLNFTAGDFLAPLYKNAFGVCVMSASFAAYLLAIKLSEKITDIKV